MRFQKTRCAWIGMGLALLLAACGGGRSDPTQERTAPTTVSDVDFAARVHAQNSEVNRETLRVRATELSRAAAGVLPSADQVLSAGSSNAVNVWRFYNPKTFRHFYTADVQET